MSNEVRKGESDESTPYCMTADDAQDALAELLRIGGEAITVPRNRLEAIAVAFGRTRNSFESLEEEYKTMRRRAEDFEKRLINLRGYMERYTNAAEHEDYCRREAEESFVKRQTALQELKRVMLEG